jgi:S1-C subfamily serine protease
MINQLRTTGKVNKRAHVGGFVCFTLTLAVISCFPVSVVSQTVPPEDPDDSKSSVQADSLAERIAPFAAGVVEVRNHDRVCCLGTILAEGWVISKNSELSGSLTCTASDGTQVSGEVIATDLKDDLALIRLSLSPGDNGSFEKFVEFKQDYPVERGDVLFTVGQKVTPIAVGVATVAPHVVPIDQPECQDCVDLGVTVSRDSVTAEVESIDPFGEIAGVAALVGAKIERVYPRTIGERIGLLKGDVLLSVNQQPVSDSLTLGSVGSKVRVGQTLVVTVVRSGEIKKLSRKVDHFSRRIYHDRWGGGPFSERRFGFGLTIVHDTLLEPKQCGGPVVDIDGNVVGINIARSTRVATLAIPSSRVQAFMNRTRTMRSESKLVAESEMDSVQ